MGERRIGQGSLAEALLPAGAGSNRRLERIAGLIDWAPMERLLAPLRAPIGRPGYPPLALFRALLLAQWYQLSDPGLEEALADRLSFRRFCGFGLDDGTPDETTLCRFRAALAERGLAEALFAELNRQLDARGLVLKAGTWSTRRWSRRRSPARRSARVRSPPRTRRPASRGVASAASSASRRMSRWISARI